MIGEWMNIQVEFVKDFFRDGNGQPSSKRLISLSVVAVFLISYMKISIPSQTLIDIPVTWGMVILGLLGLGIVSNKVENNNNS